MRSRSGSTSAAAAAYVVFCFQYLCALSFFVLVTHCDARKSGRGPLHSEMSSSTREAETLRRLDVYVPLDSSSNSLPYGVSSPFNLPPYESLAPIPLPENSPPYCVYPPPPYTPLLPPPSASVPSPPSAGGSGGGGGGGTVTSPPMPPTPTEPTLTPPSYYEPSPLIPTPIGYQPGPPSPTGYQPGGPPTPTGGPFEPPVVYPPPAVPPPPSTGTLTALWCVAKPAVPEPIIVEAMNYACASGADCDQIQPNGSCFQPDTAFAHASYAFNSYWQRTKQAGGTCEFGGTAMLVTVDPSYDGCHFTYF